MACPCAEVAIEGRDGPRGDGNEPLPATLAQDSEPAEVEVDVARLGARVVAQVGELGEAKAGVEEDPDDRRVALGFECPASGDADQGLDLGVSEDRSRSLRDARWPHLRERIDGDLALVREPSEERLATAVAVMGRGWLPLREERRHERLEVLAADQGDAGRHAALREEPGQQLRRLGVGLDGPGRQVRRRQGPCEAREVDGDVSVGFNRDGLSAHR
jgi:hypothetical protein